MGLFDKLFGNAPKPVGQYGGEFKMLDGYTPRFTSFSGGVYESELIRSAINARATHISKLRVEFQGAAKPSLRRILEHGPNDLQTWGQFLYRLSTILDCNNTAFITPTFDEFDEMSGIFSPLPSCCEVVQYDGIPYLRYTFNDGKKAAMELSNCGILTKFQYKNDLLGETNAALLPTMNLIHIQTQGIQEGVKSAASFRFWAKLSNFIKPEDLKKERQRFSKENFSAEAGGGGMLLFPNNYDQITQVKADPWVVDADSMKVIKDSVYGYFGVNDAVLQNQAIGDAWAAFYEGAIEPFAIQFSDVMTKMLYTPREQSQGNSVMATANRIQYMSNSDKLNVSSQLLDRGIMSINDVRDLWNLPPVDGGDQRVIRGEYYTTDEKLGGNENGEE